MKKYEVIIAVDVPSYATVMVEASDEAEANRIVTESIKTQEWASPYWQDTTDWDTDWTAAEDLRVV